MTCDFIQIQTTVNSEEEAKKLIHLLFENKLIACAQYFPIKSIYRWKGVIEEAEEYIIFLKTQKKLLSDIEDIFMKFHPYELPELISTCIDGISEEYSTWIKENTKE